MCDFEIGDAVVCIREDGGPALAGQILPAVGSVYIVSKVLPAEAIEDNRAGLYLSGCCGGFSADGIAWAFDAEDFRRVYRPDGSLISKLLEPVDLGEEVR